MPMTTSAASPSVSLRQLFDGVDKNKDQLLDKAEVKLSTEQAGVGSGFFGGRKVNAATDALMDAVDGNHDGNVSWAEYQQGGHKLVPAGMKLDPVRAQSDPAHIDAAVAALYADADTDGDGTLSRAELTAHQTAQAEQAGQSHASTRGEIAAALALDKLDANKDGGLQQPELAGFLKDVAREQRSAPAAPAPDPAPAASKPVTAPAVRERSR